MAGQQECVEALTARFREALDLELAALPDEAVTRDRIEERVERMQTRSGRELPPRSLERPPDAPANRAVGPAGAGQGHFPSSVRRLLLTRHGEVELRRRMGALRASRRSTPKPELRCAPRPSRRQPLPKL